MNFAAPFKVFDAAFLNEFQVSNDILVHPVNSDELRVDTGAYSRVYKVVHAGIFKFTLVLCCSAKVDKHGDRACEPRGHPGR